MNFSPKEIAAFWRDVKRIAQEAKKWPAWEKGTVDRPPSGINQRKAKQQRRF